MLLACADGAPDFSSDALMCSYIRFCFRLAPGRCFLPGIVYFFRVLPPNGDLPPNVGLPYTVGFRVSDDTAGAAAAGLAALAAAPYTPAARGVTAKRAAGAAAGAAAAVLARSASKLEPALPFRVTEVLTAAGAALRTCPGAAAWACAELPLYAVLSLDENLPFGMFLLPYLHLWPRPAIFPHFEHVLPGITSSYNAPAAPCPTRLALYW